MPKTLIPVEFLECADCRIVHSDPGLDLLEISRPAPCCGGTGASRGGWAPLEATTLLDQVEKQDETDEGRRVSVVFLAAAMEMLLEHCLLYLLRQHTNSDDLVDLVLVNNSTQSPRRVAFDALAKQKISTVLKQEGMQWFLLDWDSLAKVRNSVGHGKAYAVGKEHDGLVYGLEQSACQAFAHLYNSVTIDWSSPPRRPNDVWKLPLVKRPTRPVSP